MAYNVSYYLGKYYHSYCIDAKTEAEAILKAINSLPKTSRDFLHDFKVERYIQKWS